MSLLIKALLSRLQSLRVAIGMTVVLGVVLASFLSYLEQTSDLQKTHAAQIKLEMHRLGVLTALALREPMWQFDTEQAKSIMEAAFVNPDVLAIRVWDHDGMAFAARERAAQDASLTELTTLPIERSGVVVGKLIIKMSSAGYLNEVAALRAQYVRAALQISLGSLLVILLLMHWRLVRPVERLVQDSQRIANGRLDMPIHKWFTDEVGVLAESLEATRLSLLNLIEQLEQRHRALEQSNELLEQRVSERTAALAEALHTLELAQNEIVQTEKLASLGRVVAGVAHELNTPIGNALTVVSTLQSDLSGFKGELAKGTMRKLVLTSFVQRLDEGLQLSIGNLHRSAQLITDFKQVAVDQTSDQRRVFDMAEVSNEVLNMLQPGLRKTGCKVERQLTPDLRCDSFPGRYGQVLTNLVMNAVSHGYAEHHGGTIEVHVAPAGDRHVQIQVVDRGAGMNEAVRAQIFDPFFTTKMGSGGTGLGMNIVYNIVTRVLGGKITVQSAPGQGTTISMVIPRVTPHVTLADQV